MSRPLVLGDVMVDVVARLSGPLAPGSDSHAVIRFHGGGSAANTAAWLAQAGTEPLLVGRVGDDERGQTVRDELRAAGVEVALAVDPELPTGTCIVLVGPDGERTMAPDAGANDGLAETDLPDELLASAAHLHVAGYALLRSGSRPAARAAISRALERGLSVSVDPSSAALLSPEFLDHAAARDCCCRTRRKHGCSAASAIPRAPPERWRARFSEVVVTLGADGALWTDGCRSVHRDAVPVEAVVDSTGAGDAFAAGLLAARLEGAAPEEALAAGARLAAEAVGRPGGRP